MKPNIRAIRDKRLKEANEKAEEAHAKAHEKGKGKGHEKHHDDPPTPVSADLVRPPDGIGIVDTIPPPPVSAEPVVTIVPDNADAVIKDMKDFTWNKKPKKQKKQKKQKKTRRDFDGDSSL